MRKPIEDEIHDIIMRNIDTGTAKLFGGTCTSAKQVPLNMKDIEHMLAEVDKLAKVPDLQYVLIARDGKTIQVERVIDLNTATEDDIAKVFRNRPDLGIDLTGAQLVSFGMPKLNWQAPIYSMGVWEPSLEDETDDTEDSNEIA